MYKQFCITLYKLCINSISYSKLSQFLMDINVENVNNNEISNITAEII